MQRALPMTNLVEITKIINKKKEDDFIRKLDLQASYVALEMCLKTIEINSLPELKSIKESIKKTMKLLASKER